MELLISIVVGAVAGGLAALVFRPFQLSLSTSLTVGILGGLLGLAADFWLATGGFTTLAFSELVASGVGALLALTLWIVAQRLFLDAPVENVIVD